MSAYRTKSTLSLKAMEVLQEHEPPMYSSSIHCGYYSCIQLIYHFFVSSHEYSINDINHIHYTAKDKGVPFHPYIFNEFLRVFDAISDDAIEIKDDLELLKKDRARADYTNEATTVSMAEESLARTISIRERIFDGYGEPYD